MVARMDTELKRILISEGRTQSWLSRTTGVDRSQINRYVHGIHDPDSRIKEAIASALGRPVGDVFPAHSDGVSSTATGADGRVGTFKEAA